MFSEDIERAILGGIVKYSDGSHDKGDLVGFTPNSEYEFIIDGERLYRVYSINLLQLNMNIKETKKTYNPSWA